PALGAGGRWFKSNRPDQSWIRRWPARGEQPNHNPSRSLATLGISATAQVLNHYPILSLPICLAKGHFPVDNFASQGGESYAQSGIAGYHCPARYFCRPQFPAGGGLGDQRHRNRGLQLSSLLHVLFQSASGGTPRARQN